MSIGYELMKRLNKKYEPGKRIDAVFKGNAITILTDETGAPVTLFIGRRNEDGSISGERYSRRTKVVSGEIKSHWDNKGKVSRY